jgi:hypothetical protein
MGRKKRSENDATGATDDVREDDELEEDVTPAQDTTALEGAGLVDPNQSPPEPPERPPPGTPPAPGEPIGPESDDELARSAMRIETELKTLSREQKLELLILRTDLSEQEVGQLSQEGIDDHVRAVLEQDELDLRAERAERAGTDPALRETFARSSTTPAPGGVPPPEPVAEPRGMRIQAQLQALSRPDKIGLLAQRTNLTVQEAAQLPNDEIDQHVRAVLEQDELSKEALEQQLAAAQNPRVVGDPYGGDKPQHYAVRENLRGVMIGGQIVQLRAGQVITDRSHNVPELEKYGAKLVKCEAPDPFVPQY